MAGIAHTSGTLYWHTIRDLLNQYGAKVVDSDAASAYDSRGNINCQARWKPVKYREMFRQDIDSSLPHYIPRWWGANDGRCGIKLDDIIYTSTASLSGVSDAATLWKHDYPTGGSTDRFNPQDFRGYDPEAKIIDSFYNPIGEDIIIGVESGGNMVSVKFGQHGVDSPSLDYMDILYKLGGAVAESNLSILYLGLIAIRSDGKYHGVVSLPYTMKQLNSLNDLDDGVYYAMDDHYAGISVSGNLFKMTGEYRVYPVLFALSQDARSAEGAISCGEYVPLPVKPITVNAVTLSSYFYISDLAAKRNTSTTNTTVSFEIQNDGASIVTGGSNPYRFVVRWFAYTGYPSDYPDKQYSEYTVTQQITIAGGANTVSFNIPAYPSSGQLLDLQVVLYRDSTIAAQISNSFINPF